MNQRFPQETLNLWRTAVQTVNQQVGSVNSNLLAETVGKLVEEVERCYALLDRTPGIVLQSAITEAIHILEDSRGSETLRMGVRQALEVLRDALVKTQRKLPKITDAELFMMRAMAYTWLGVEEIICIGQTGVIGKMVLSLLDEISENNGTLEATKAQDKEMGAVIPELEAGQWREGNIPPNYRPVIVPLPRRTVEYMNTGILKHYEPRVYWRGCTSDVATDLAAILTPLQLKHLAVDLEEKSRVKARRCDECDPSFGCFNGSQRCSRRPLGPEPDQMHGAADQFPGTDDPEG